MQKTYKQLFLMLLVFIIPLATAWVLFNYHNYFNLKTLNHGILIQPVDVKYLFSEIDKIPQKKWRIIYVASVECDSQCQEMDHQLKQVQKALGKERDRVSTLIINHKTMTLTQLQLDMAQHVNSKFSVTNKIYLVDPLNNLFMYYPGNANLVDVLNDVKRVLEVSQIG